MPAPRNRRRRETGRTTRTPGSAGSAGFGDLARVGGRCLAGGALLRVGGCPLADQEGGRADVGQRADVAGWVLGLANLAAEPDQPVAERGPLLLGQEGHQVLL